MSALQRQHEEALRDRRRIAGFALVCAIAVGGFVWWNVGGASGSTAAPAPSGDEPAASSSASAPAASVPEAPAPTKLPASWTFVQEALVPVASAGEPQLPVTVEDSRGVAVEVADLDRVIVGGDDVIEFMDSIGLSGAVFAAPEGTTLVTGRDAPEHFEFNKDTGPEGILALDATLFFGNSVRKHASVVKGLAATGMPAVIVEQNQPAVPKIRMIGALLGRPDAGNELANAVQAQLTEGANIAKARGGRAPRVLHVAVGGGGRATAVGAKTPPHDVITAAGGVDVAAEAGLELYAEMNDEGVLASKPDVILITVADLATWKGPNGLWKIWPTLRRTPAGRANRVFVMPDAQLSGGSVASGAGVVDLANALNSVGGRP